jgi:hypothetical protein
MIKPLKINSVREQQDLYVWVLGENQIFLPPLPFPHHRSNPPTELRLHAALRSSTVVFSDSAGMLNLGEYACPWRLFSCPQEHSLDAPLHRARPAALLRHPAHLIWHDLCPLLLRPSPTELRSLSYRARAHGGFHA